MTQWNLPPAEIERRSLEIIAAEAGDHGLDEPLWSVVARMIHTTADFDWIKNVMVGHDAIAAGIRAIRSGCAIFTDTNMAAAGIGGGRLKPFGCVVRCLVAEPAVAARAKAEGITRSIAAVDQALPELDGAIYVVGNAPTALFRLIEHVRAGRANPALVVGLPVGFVNAAESKEELVTLDHPFFTSLGRKGGSAVAASVINALAILAAGEEENV